MAKISGNLELKGRLVWLRPVDPQYYPAMQKILSDPMTVSILNHVSHAQKGGWTLEHVKKRYEKRMQQQKEQKGIVFIMVSPDGKDVYGSCGFSAIDLPHKNAKFRLTIGHSYWGKGITTECFLLCLEYVYTQLQLHRVEIFTLDTNQLIRGFFDKMGVPFESMRKEYFFENGSFVNDCVFAIFPGPWNIVKENLENRLRYQTGSSG